MKIFSCQKCDQIVYFENTSCERCGSLLGYLPEREEISAVQSEGRNWIALADPGGVYRFCKNWEMRACNWLLHSDEEATQSDDEAGYCVACRHNHAIPDVSDAGRKLQWQRIEEAKRRLFYSLIKFRLPIPTVGSGSPEPLVFDFLADLPNQKKIMTGHDNGTITISLQEADDAAREQLRSQMGEAYRTLLGHFRHEVGHYYWDLLVRDRGHLDQCRAIFGDERADYDEALKRYYVTGAPESWRDDYVSAYATMHPWEDFAETWAHYIHIVDTLEMAYAFGLSVFPRASSSESLSTSVDQNPYRAKRIETIIEAWLPVSTAVNNLNRTMGQPDLYPFVLSPAVVTKLGYIHRLIGGAAVDYSSDGLAVSRHGDVSELRTRSTMSESQSA